MVGHRDDAPHFKKIKIFNPSKDVKILLFFRAMGFRPSKEELMDILSEIDEDGSGEIEFEEFCQVKTKLILRHK